MSERGCSWRKGTIRRWRYVWVEEAAVNGLSDYRGVCNIEWDHDFFDRHIENYLCSLSWKKCFRASLSRKDIGTYDRIVC